MTSPARRQLEAEMMPAATGDDETINTSARSVFYDPNGASRTGVRLEAGAYDGQRVKVCNVETGAYTITFATEVTSLVVGGTENILNEKRCREFVWCDTISRWFIEDI